MRLHFKISIMWFYNTAFYTTYITTIYTGSRGVRGSHYFKKVPKMSPKGFWIFFYIQKMSPAKGFDPRLHARYYDKLFVLQVLRLKYSRQRQVLRFVPHHIEVFDDAHRITRKSEKSPTHDDAHNFAFFLYGFCVFVFV